MQAWNMEHNTLAEPLPEDDYHQNTFALPFIREGLVKWENERKAVGENSVTETGQSQESPSHQFLAENFELGRAE